MARLRQCSNGHYYDPSMHSECPYCAHPDYVDPVYDNPDFSYTDFTDKEKQLDGANEETPVFDSSEQASYDPEYVSETEINWQLFTKDLVLAKEKGPERQKQVRNTNKLLYPVNVKPDMPAIEKRTNSEVNSNAQELLDLFTDIGRAAADPIAFRQRVTELQAAKNKHIQENYSDPDYGLVPEKPIFVKGFGLDREYLSHLYTYSGKKIRYSRTGSEHVAGVSGPVDRYALDWDNANTSPGMIIYLSVYGTLTSTNAPRGLVCR